jgi:metalloendopeptidase OMA1, mitochondrial
MSLFLSLQGLDWAFVVVDEPIPNAFVVPGGKVVIYTGLLDILKSDDELAAVISHEVAHVVARHMVRSLWRAFLRVVPFFLQLKTPFSVLRWQSEKLMRMGVYTVFQILLSIVTGFSFPDAIFQLGFALPNSRYTTFDQIAVWLDNREFVVCVYVCLSAGPLARAYPATGR